MINNNNYLWKSEELNKICWDANLCYILSPRVSV